MTCTIVWLRDDLRVADNPALAAAIEHGEPVVVVYILDEVSPGIRPLGGATKWWLHHSLVALSDKVRRLGGELILKQGASADIIRGLIRETNASALYWNRRYGKPERDLDASIKEYAKASGVDAHSFQANVLFEPWTVRTGNDTPYTVFTPFWKSCVNRPTPPRLPIPAPTELTPPATQPASDELDSWNLLPTSPNWALAFDHRWNVGENGAHQALERFFDSRITRYAKGRDFPSEYSTSELSPHLRWGEISPFQIWHATDEFRRKMGNTPEITTNATKFLSELGWREFSYHLLYHWPELATVNFDARFDHFPWGPADPDILDAWQQGITGIPLVDAGMRELWQTGYMHNRVRMVAASFLIKNLLIDWRIGEAWFWDTLVDADPASNAASWQWVAGSGADAAPYFRVFNPKLQAEKFDPKGEYLHRYLGDYEHPMLSGYPEPIIDLLETRNRALEAFKTLGDIPRQIRPPVVDL